MNDEAVTRGPGRPRKNPLPEGKPEPKPHKMRAKPNWESLDPLADESPDRLKINRELIPEGMSLQWVADSVYGQALPQNRSKFERKGWTPVHQEDFDGVFDGMFMKKGDDSEINLGGLVLMARPKEATERAKLIDKRNANEQVQIKEQALRGGDLPVSLDSRHSSALQTNRISKTVERIAIPED